MIYIKISVVFKNNGVSNEELIAKKAGYVVNTDFKGGLEELHKKMQEKFIMFNNKLYATSNIIMIAPGENKKEFTEDYVRGL